MDPPLDKSDFRRFAHTLEASRDVGAQLFCALLRSVGVETRLVSSLQPLPFLATAPKAPTPVKAVADYVHEQPSESVSEGEEAIDIQALAAVSGAVPRVARKLGQPDFGLTATPANRSPRPASGMSTSTSAPCTYLAEHMLSVKQ